MRKQKEETRRHKVSGHGSTTKAGKVRNQTPKIPKSVDHSKHGCPRVKNRKRYYKRVILNRRSGQNWKRE